MKRCKCDLCFSDAAYVSGNSGLHLCEECYMSMEDDFEASFEDEVGMSFDEYYDMREVDEAC